MWPSTIVPIWLGGVWHRVLLVHVSSSPSSLGFLGTKQHHKHSTSNTSERFGLSCNRQGNSRKAEMPQVCSSSFFSQDNSCSTLGDTPVGQTAKHPGYASSLSLNCCLPLVSAGGEWAKASSTFLTVLLFSSSNMFSFVQANHTASPSLYSTTYSFAEASVLYYLYEFLTSSL